MESTEPELSEYLIEMSKSKESNIKSKLEILLLHLLKYKYQPSRQGGGSWERSIREAQARLEDSFNDSKTLYNKYLDSKFYLKSYQRARLIAAAETKLPLEAFPVELPWDPKEVWTFEFMTDFLFLYNKEHLDDQ